MLRWTASGGEGFEVSLNRYEQAIFEYFQSHPDECRHWENKVASRAARGELRSSLLNLAEYLIRRWGPAVTTPNRTSG